MSKVTQIRINGVLYNINDDRIFVGTTEDFSDSTLIPRKNDIYVYSDARVEDGITYPGIKVADGKAYLVDLPFLGDSVAKVIEDHISNDKAHVSEEDREFWNNKVSCKIEENENENILVFSVD